MTGEDLKIYGLLLAALTAFVKVLQWLFTDKTKVAVLEQRLAVIEDKLDALTKGVTEALDKGSDRMQKHEDEIKGIQIELAGLRPRSKTA